VSLYVPVCTRPVWGRLSVTETILIADDHPLFCEALEVTIQRIRPKAQILRAGSLKAARAVVSERHPSLVLLDLMMPDSRGFVGLVTLRQEHQDIPVVVVSASDEEGVVARSRAFGARGFIPKSASLGTMQAAIANVLAGDEWWPEGSTIIHDAHVLNGDTDVVHRLSLLTPAQMRVLVGLTEGLLNKQIAYDMNISEATVKAHVTAVFRKLNVINRTQAVIAARALQMPSDGPGELH
jgi:DNA-binding NarL/FixJ family response regulator